MLQSEKGRLAAGAVRGLARLAEIAGQKVQVVFAEADGLPELSWRFPPVGAGAHAAELSGRTLNSGAAFN